MISKRNITAFFYSRWLYFRGIKPNQVVGDADNPNAIPVVMCVWNRIDSLTSVITALDEQKGSPPIRLFLWNNSSSSNIENLIQKLPLSGSCQSVAIVNSRFNIGGMGRFHLGRYLLQKNTGSSTGAMIMIDDDQIVGPTFIATLLKKFVPQGYGSVWAYVMISSYWDRTEPADGEPANYCGTGGSVIDTRAFGFSTVFTSLPVRYFFIEDLWLSFFLTKQRWRLYKIDANYEFINDETNIYRSLINDKDCFYHLLTKRFK